jgi:succinyl-diaminopimelate desuccinylase
MTVTDVFAREKMIEDLKALISIPSVGAGPAGHGAPYGLPVAEALEFMLVRGRDMGFKTGNADGYAGYIEYGNRGPLAAILCHLDVVPGGDGWSGSPFEARIEGGRLYGRGASDNKGPAVSALHILSAFRQRHPDPPFRLRLILGTDEERTMGGIDYYIGAMGMPDYAIVPDAEYPMVTREKGIIDLDIRSAGRRPGLVAEFSAGEAYNVVPDKAEARILPAGEAPFEELAAAGGLGADVRLERRGEELFLAAKGVSAHGGTPEKGRNAIAALVRAIADADPSGVAEPQLMQLSRLLAFSVDGRDLGIATPPEAGDTAGGLTINWGKLKVDREGVHAGINLRYPVGTDFEPLYAKMEAALSPHGFTINRKIHLTPHHVPEDSSFVKALRRAYEAETGLEGTPQSMAGGTYARKITGKGIAFGAIFPGSDTRAHQGDEFIDLDDLMKHSAIVLRALEEMLLLDI